MIRICQGNDFAVKIEVERLVWQDGQKKVEDFLLDEVKELEVCFTWHYKRIEMDYYTDGNTLVVLSRSRIKEGDYGIEITATDKDGVHLRYAADNFIKIVKTTDQADVPEDVEFDVNIYNLGVVAVYMGGSSDNTKKDIEKLKASIHALSLGAKLTLSASPTVAKKNVSTSIKLTATFSGVTPDSIAIYDGERELVSVSELLSVTVTVPENLSADKGYKAVAYYNGMQFNASVNVAVRDCVLYGFCNASATPSKELSARTSAITTYEDTAKENGQVFCIYVPNGVTAPTKFSMGGAPAVFNKSTKVVGGITYTVFTSGGTYNSGAKLTIKAE